MYAIAKALYTALWFYWGGFTIIVWSYWWPYANGAHEIPKQLGYDLFKSADKAKEDHVTFEQFQNEQVLAESNANWKDFFGQAEEIKYDSVPYDTWLYGFNLYDDLTNKLKEQDQEHEL